VNCHQTIDASDFIGSMRPLRPKKRLQLRGIAIKAIRSYFSQSDGPDHPMVAEVDFKTASFNDLLRLLDSVEPKTPATAESAGGKRLREDEALASHALKSRRTSTSVTQPLISSEAVDDSALSSLRSFVLECKQQSEQLFEWSDGPLIESMHDGSIFLLDEVSLAEDAVLERLNSVLEPERKLTVPERSRPVGV